MSRSRVVLCGYILIHCYQEETKILLTREISLDANIFSNKPSRLLPCQSDKAAEIAELLHPKIFTRTENEDNILEKRR